MRCKTPAFHVRLLTGVLLLLAVLLALPGSALATRDTPLDGLRPSSEPRYAALNSASTPSPAPPSVRAGADVWSDTSGPAAGSTITLTGDLHHDHSHRAGL